MLLERTCSIGIVDSCGVLEEGSSESSCEETIGTVSGALKTIHVKDLPRKSNDQSFLGPRPSKNVGIVLVLVNFIRPSR